MFDLGSSASPRQVSNPWTHMQKPQTVEQHMFDLGHTLPAPNRFSLKDPTDTRDVSVSDCPVIKGVTVVAEALKATLKLRNFVYFYLTVIVYA